MYILGICILCINIFAVCSIDQILKPKLARQIYKGKYTQRKIYTARQIHTVKYIKINIHSHITHRQIDTVASTQRDILEIQIHRYTYFVNTLHSLSQLRGHVPVPFLSASFLKMLVLMALN